MKYVLIFFLFQLVIIIQLAIVKCDFNMFFISPVYITCLQVNALSEIALHYSKNINFLNAMKTLFAD